MDDQHATWINAKERLPCLDLPVLGCWVRHDGYFFHVTRYFHCAMICGNTRMLSWAVPADAKHEYPDFWMFIPVGPEVFYCSPPEYVTGFYSPPEEVGVGQA